jgi:hypothetical protein
MMPRQTQESDASFIARLGKGLQCTTAAKDHLEVTGSSQIVQLPQIQMVGAQSLEAFIKQPERAIASAIMGLGGKEDLATALPQRGSVVIKAAGISR